MPEFVELCDYFFQDYGDCARFQYVYVVFGKLLRILDLWKPILELMSRIRKEM